MIMILHFFSHCSLPNWAKVTPKHIQHSRIAVTPLLSMLLAEFLCRWNTRPRRIWVRVSLYDLWGHKHSRWPGSDDALVTETKGQLGRGSLVTAADTRYCVLAMLGSVTVSGVSTFREGGGISPAERCSSSDRTWLCLSVLSKIFLYINKRWHLTSLLLLSFLKYLAKVALIEVW